MNSKTMHRFGLRVHAPINCTTFLCRTFLIIATSCAEDSNVRHCKVHQITTPQKLYEVQVPLDYSQAQARQCI